MKQLLSTGVLVVALSLISACSTTKKAEKAPVNAPEAIMPQNKPTSSSDGAKTARAEKPSTISSNVGTTEKKAEPSRASDAATLADTTRSGNILCKRSAYFDYDQSEVNPAYHDILQAHARLLAGLPSAHALLQGNTDARGSREYNLALGQRRADSVKQTLVSLGAPSGNISTVSLGKESPRAQGDDEDSWRINRRVDLLYGNEKVVPSCSNETP